MHRLIACSLLLAACSAPVVEAPLGDVVVRVEPDQGRLQIRRADGTVILDGVPGGPVASGQPPAVGAAFRTSQPSWMELYGAFLVDESGAPDWTPVTRFSNVSVASDGVRFDLDGGGQGQVLRVGDGTLQISFARPGQNRASAAFRCTPDEQFLGFGAMPEDVQHRGSTVPIWVSEQGIGRVDTDDPPGDWFFRGTRHQSYFPVPFFVSSRNYGVRGDTSFRSIYSMCSEGDDSYWRVEAWEGTVSFHLFYGSSPLDVVRLHAALDGAPPPPPAFAFAPWNDAVGGSATVRQIESELRQNHIPSSVIWTEDWAGADSSTGMLRLTYDWTVDRTRYPDVEALATELHQNGFKWLAYFNTFAPTSSDHFQPQFLIQSPSGGPYVFDSVQLGKQTSMVDLTNPDAATWMAQAMDAAIGLGFDGWMADYGEWLPVDAALANGQNAEGQHDLYPLMWQQLNARVIDARAADGVERVSFVRSGFTGSQAIAHQVVWGGDQSTDFDPGDGLPSVLPIALGLGVAGMPMFGSDIAGYMTAPMHAAATKELFFRWSVLGALSPVMRTHHGSSPQANWHFDSDAETLQHWKRWATVHTQLYPYLSTLASQAASDGAPLMRQLALGFPDDATAWTLKDEYLLGPSLLVAPVIEAGVTSRTVYLPAGHWVRLFGAPGAADVDGPASPTVDAPLGELPVFAPSGAIVPMLPAGVDTLVGASSSSLVGLSQVGDAREVTIVLGANGSFTEAGGIAYTLSSSTASAIAALSWNGVALPACASPAVAPCASVEASGAAAVVSGAGTLASGGGEFTFSTTGGAAARPLTVHVAW